MVEDSTLILMHKAGIPKVSMDFGQNHFRPQKMSKGHDKTDSLAGKRVKQVYLENCIKMIMTLE